MHRFRHLLLAIGLLCAAHTAHAQAYTYEAFDYPGATDTSPQAIDHTAVAGWYDISGVGFGHGFTYDTVGHTFTTFDDPSGTQGTFATGINGTTVVGQSANTNGYVGFTYDTGTHVFTDFSVFGSNTTAAYGINGSNIAGFYRDGDIERGFLLTGGVGGTPTSISYPGAANTEFFGITGNRIVGQYQDGSNADLYRGFIYNIDTTTFTILHDPAAPGINATVPTGISGNLVTGYYFDADVNYVGFLYDISTDTYTNLTAITPNLGVQPNGLSGVQVVGSYFDGTTGVYRGFSAIVPEPADFALGAGWAAVGFAALKRRRFNR